MIDVFNWSLCPTDDFGVAINCTTQVTLHFPSSLYDASSSSLERTFGAGVTVGVSNNKTSSVVAQHNDIMEVDLANLPTFKCNI